MNYFISRFAARPLTVLALALAPNFAAAQDAPLLTVISSNNPTTVAPVEPVVISRSGLAVPRHDYQGTGGLNGEIATGAVALSARPSPRLRTAEVAVTQAQRPAPAVGLFVRGRDAQRTVPLRNRQLVAAPPRPATVRTARPATPAPARANQGPAYLLGVFR